MGGAPWALPMRVPYNVPTKAGAVTGPPATMPDDVVMLAWFGPLAVNVPDEAVMPLGNVRPAPLP